MADSSKKYVPVDADAEEERAVSELANRLRLPSSQQIPPPPQPSPPSPPPSPPRPTLRRRQPAPAPSVDRLVQIAFAARFSTRKQMFQIARDKDVTLKTLILSALREKYPELDIREADLVDLRVNRPERP